MKIELEGWLRHVLIHTLMESDISKVKPSEDGVPSVSEARLRWPTKSGELVIRGHAEGVSLNSDFEVSVRLNKDEIANLARIAFEKDSFSDVIGLLSRKDSRGR